jgi:hypothetical protein
MATSEAQKRANQKAWEKRRAKELEWIMERLGKVKICSKCGFEGDISLFRNDYTINYDKPSKRQIRGTCNECRKKSIKENNSCPIKKKKRAKREWERVKASPERLQKKKERSKVYQSQPRVKKMRSEATLKQRAVKPHLYRWRKLLWNTYKQVGKVKPANIKTNDALGYSAIELFNYLGDKPTTCAQIDCFLSDTPTKISCDLRNLEWKSKSDNGRKADHYADPICEEYYNLIQPYIKVEYQNRITIKSIPAVIVPAVS